MSSRYLDKAWHGVGILDFLNGTYDFKLLIMSIIPCLTDLHMHSGNSLPDRLTYT